MILQTHHRQQRAAAEPQERERETHPSSSPLPSTACTPPTLLPSLITANEIFFCRLQDLIQPLMVMGASEELEDVACWRAEAMVVGKGERRLVEVYKSRDVLATGDAREPRRS